MSLTPIIFPLTSDRTGGKLRYMVSFKAGSAPQVCTYVHHHKNLYISALAAKHTHHDPTLT